jgi:hypothetical protein
MKECRQAVDRSRCLAGLGGPALVLTTQGPSPAYEARGLFLP